jgi:hypothetical protein
VDVRADVADGEGEPGGCVAEAVAVGEGMVVAVRVAVSVGRGAAVGDDASSLHAASMSVANRAMSRAGAGMRRMGASSPG